MADSTAGVAISIVWRHFLTGNGIREFGMVQVRLNVIQIIVDQGRGLLLEGDKKRFLHIVTGDFVVLPACLGDELIVALAVCLFELTLALNPIFDGPQNINRVDTTCLRLDQGGRDAVDDEAR